jgi:hypothetical protein
MKNRVLLLPLLLILSACTSSFPFAPESDALPTLSGLTRVRLVPGQPLAVPLTITAPKNGTAITTVTASSPTDLVSVQIDGAVLTLQAGRTVLPQGLIPITVTVQTGEKSVSVRVPVEIGDIVEREFQRFVAVRAQAGLGPVIFDENDSMNCWLHGRYSVVNNIMGHTEDPTLSFFSNEGRDCANTSNLSSMHLTNDRLDQATPSTDQLFTAPFHAVGMLNPDQRSVGIGLFAQAVNNRLVQTRGGITSRGGVRGTGTLVTFPGTGTTTDFLHYAGGEAPDPLTPCPGIDAQTAGLPLIAMLSTDVETTASQASLTVDGQAVPVCAYGSTQYTNALPAPISYLDGPVSQQDVGRRQLRGNGAVFMIPQQPLLPGRHYQASVTINDTPVRWSFSTAPVSRL